MYYTNNIIPYLPRIVNHVKAKKTALYSLPPKDKGIQQDQVHSVYGCLSGVGRTVTFLFYIMLHTFQIHLRADKV